MWEYKIIQLRNPERDTVTLNELGADRWELVTVLDGGRMHPPTAFLKRSI